MRRLFAASPLIALALVITGASCGPQVQWSSVGSGGSGSFHECTADTQCDDTNPCTTDTCDTDHACRFTALDGAPASQQTLGDCITTTCVEGVATDVPNDADVGDDGEDCTVDSCQAGVPSHVPKPAGTPCTAAGSPGSCGPQGMCLAGDCFNPASCPPPGPCEVASCDPATAACAFAPVPDGTPTPGAPQTAGDCQMHVCFPGMDTNVDDDADVGDDGNPCTVDGCMDGGPFNVPVPAGTPCGANMLCNSIGQCM
jgi:hypothetical protein